MFESEISMDLTAELLSTQTAAKSNEKDFESPFQIDELFFSHTDERGVIQAYNSVFARISEYPDDVLNGAPHKVIRHPDMPKGVFWLIWDTIKAGNPITGYVKNRSKSGKYYWVYAIIAPIEGGFLSVWMKPTSPTFEVATELYSKLLQHEREDGLSPEASAELLIKELQAKGFDDYADFEAHALIAEYQSRERQLGRLAFGPLTQAIRVAEAQRTICEKITSITEELGQGKIYILNMKLQATKLGKDRAAIDAIANNYDLILEDINTGINRLKRIMAEAVDSNFKQSKQSQILLCAASIMSEVVHTFGKSEEPIDVAVRTHEAEILDRLHDSQVGKSNEAVSVMMDQCRQVLSRMDSLRQTLLGLSAVRVSLRVETNRLGEKARDLDSLIADIDASHLRVHNNLETVFETASALQSAILAR